jgi:hypothetical protein
LLTISYICSAATANTRSVADNDFAQNLYRDVTAFRASIRFRLGFGPSSNADERSQVITATIPAHRGQYTLLLQGAPRIVVRER